MSPKLTENISLKALNTFGVDVNARYYAKVNSLQQIHQLLNNPKSHALPKLILGQGSNILFTQNFDGLVIQNTIRGIEIIKEDANHVWLKIGAGENWHAFVEYCIEHNYAGVENLSLIPGTVGAAPIQNIGAYGAELKDVFCELSAIKLDDGSEQVFQHHNCDFGYRHSIFKAALKNQYIITTVTLKLSKHPQFNIDYGALRYTLEQMKIKTLSIKHISNAVVHIRRSKLPDPKKIGNAGSFFKNPYISLSTLKKLLNQYPDIPHHPLPNNEVKIPAAWLIEQCGWKGKKFGNFGVHDKQALVLVNHGSAKGHEIAQLAKDIQDSVAKKFNITLVPEVNIL